MMIYCKYYIQHMKLKKILFIFGTRPEAIKLSPVIKEFRSSGIMDTKIILTGQHKEMVEQIMESFHIKFDKNLNIMQTSQSLSQITSKCLIGLQEIFNNFKPSLIIVQGDTSTAFAGALAGFYNNIPIAHVEAGLRTNNKIDPFPEELNRRLISQIASLHFCPTKKAKLNLINEKIDGEIFITGNTVIDSLFYLSKNSSLPKIDKLNWSLKKIILITVHRRENWGENLVRICKGILSISKRFEDINIVIPMHKNPIVREIIISILSGYKNIFLTEPFDYGEFVAVMKESELILSDSGGIQQEAPVLGKPVLVLRETTERSEGIDAGTSKLVGTSPDNILSEVTSLLRNKKEYEKMSTANNPYGDGTSSKKILNECIKFLDD